MKGKRKQFEDGSSIDAFGIVDIEGGEDYEEPRPQMARRRDPAERKARREAQNEACLLYTSPSPRDRG